MYIRVELPTYAHSFSVDVPNDANVLQLKQEISRSCPGSPRVEGQRIIWRGRYLSDGEKLEALWSVSKDCHITRTISYSCFPSPLMSRVLSTFLSILQRGPLIHRIITKNHLQLYRHQRLFIPFLQPLGYLVLHQYPLLSLPVFPPTFWQNIEMHSRF